jgi:flagellin-like hook-associated protein FlgL
LDTLNSTFGDKYIFAGYNTPGETNLTGEAPKPFRMLEEDVTSIDPGWDPALGTEPGTGLKGDIMYNDFNVSAVIRANPNHDFNAPYTGTDPDMMMFYSLRSNVLTFDVGPGVEVPVTFNGIDLILFKSSIGEDGTPVTPAINRNIFDVLNALLEDTHDGKPAAELGTVYIKQLQQGQNHLLTQVAEVIMNQKMAEAVYQAALSAGARVIQPTLMDFLR